jgi:hypothetical protein
MRAGGLPPRMVAVSLLLLLLLLLVRPSMPSPAWNGPCQKTKQTVWNTRNPTTTFSLRLRGGMSADPATEKVIREAPQSRLSGTLCALFLPATCRPPARLLCRFWCGRGSQATEPPPLPSSGGRVRQCTPPPALGRDPRTCHRDLPRIYGAAYQDSRQYARHPRPALPANLVIFSAALPSTPDGDGAS